MGKAPGAPPRSIKARALQLLSQREHSRAELRRKLLPTALAAVSAQGGDASVDDDVATLAQRRVEGVLDWLEANRHLSEHRFVESRVHARAPRYGNLRILRELAEHESRLAPELKVELKESEQQRARGVWARKFSAPPSNAAERAKQSRFLARRGFSAEVIHRLMREVGSSPPRDEEVGADTD
jgi:regulatory protein